MPSLDFLFHLPLLRIEDEIVPFDAGSLYKLPFERYNQFSSGAFEDHRRHYEATGPVFLAVSVPVSAEGLERRTDEVQGVVEIKMPLRKRAMLARLGLSPINEVYTNFVRDAWTALLLAAPASALAPPGWSQSFMAIDQGYTISVGGRPTVAVRVQGEADHEYLFLPDAVSEQVPRADLERAGLLVDSVRHWEHVPELHAALSALRATASPLLSHRERMTLAVVALESLLLPEVQTRLEATFARRLPALLASDRASANRLSTIAQDLYGLRSESLHGKAIAEGGYGIDAALAEQLLSLSIQRVGAHVANGDTLDDIRERIDAGYRRTEGTPVVNLQQQPTGRAASDRLARSRPSDVFVGLSPMAAKEGRVCCWSPLLGLTTEGLDPPNDVMVLGEPPAAVLMPLSPDELFSLEERDIRRDFMSQYWATGKPMAVLMTVPEHDGETDGIAATPWLERMRDLAVVALRLAGYDRFVDPELFGSAVFEGSRRLRRPTVLRQTVAERVRHDAEQRIGPADGQRLADIWKELRGYLLSGHVLRIENILSLFRRSFHGDFLEQEERALILFSLVEGMLDRFRPRSEPVQLEDLVTALVADQSDSEWFRSEGRRVRNAVAHGRFEPNEESDALERLSRIVAHLVRAMLATWNARSASDRDRDPSDLLIAHATAQHNAPKVTGERT